MGLSFQSIQKDGRMYRIKWQSTIIIQAILLSVVFASQPAGAQATDSDRATLMQLEAVWNEAHLKADATALTQLWDDDLQVAVPGMLPLTKETSLSVLRNSTVRFDKYETSAVEVRLYGDAAVVTGRLLRSRKMGDRVANDDWRFTKVYVRRPAGWRVVAFHTSPSPPAQ
jgi:ketosteroid isomerase-like protein